METLEKLPVGWAGCSDASPRKPRCPVHGVQRCKNVTFEIIAYNVCYTVANSVRFFLSTGLLAHVAKNCNIFGVGGVVMSRNRVSKVRREHLGSFSCGDQFFETPKNRITRVLTICVWKNEKISYD